MQKGAICESAYKKENSKTSQKYKNVYINTGWDFCLPKQWTRNKYYLDCIY